MMSFDLLRQLERGDQTIGDNQPRGRLNRLVDEGYVSLFKMTAGKMWLEKHSPSEKEYAMSRICLFWSD
jgi:hypothetical protein